MYKSMKDLLVSSRDSSPVRERAGLSLSAVKSLVLGEKEEKSELGDDEKVQSLIRSVLGAEGNFPRRKIGSCSETPKTLSLYRDIHGAPPESFVVMLSEVIGSYKTLRKMSLFWCRVVEELSLGFVIAEATVCTNSNLSKLFNECKDYIVATCQSHN